MLATLLAAAVTPGVIGKLREEQSQVVKQHGDDLSFDVLQHSMPYLDACIRESTRVLPATHTLFR